MRTVSYQTSKRSRIKTGPADFAALFALVLVITLLGAFLFWQY